MNGEGLWQTGLLALLGEKARNSRRIFNENYLLVLVCPVSSPPQGFFATTEKSRKSALV
jgi:hypothetical protein